MGKKVIDLTGRVFGSLKVLRRADTKGGRAKWECLCLTCNNVCTVRGDHLVSSRVKSCGCEPKRKATDGLGEYEMRKVPDSLSALTMGDDPYRNLANAIVAVAADDYRMALKEDNQPLKNSLEQFFHSDWYKLLTRFNGDRMLSLLQREHSGELCAVNL